MVLDKGVVSQIGRPLDLYNRLDNKFVASFIGAPTMNFVPARVANFKENETSLDIGEAGKITCRLRNGDGQKPSGEVELELRPEYISLADPNSKSANLKGSVLLVERLGNTTIVYVEQAIGPIVVQDGENEKLAFGDNVGLRFDIGRVHVLGADGKVI